MNIRRFLPERYTRVATSATKLYLEITIANLSVLVVAYAVDIIVTVKLPSILLAVDVLIVLVFGVVTVVMLRRAVRSIRR
jgi:membrane protein implicated in regulation of membrane protease activity